MKRIWIYLALFCGPVFAHSAAALADENTLTEAERRGGWKLTRALSYDHRLTQ